MPKRFSTSTRPHLKSISLLVAASFLMTPLTAFGESITFRQTASQTQSVSNTPHNTSGNKAILGLDAEGNVMIKYGDLSAKLLCDPSDRQESKNLPGLSSKDSDVALLGRIAVEISINF